MALRPYPIIPRPTPSTATGTSTTANAGATNAGRPARTTNAGASHATAVTRATNRTRASAETRANTSTKFNKTNTMNKVQITDVNRPGTTPVQAKPKSNHVLDAIHRMIGAARDAVSYQDTYTRDPALDKPKPVSKSQKNLDSSHNKALDKGQAGVGFGEPANPPKSKPFPAPAVMKAGRRIVK